MRSLVAIPIVLALLAVHVHAAEAPSTTAADYLQRFIDPLVSPREDYFQHAVGKWLRENPIPASERAWGIGNVVQEETYRRLVGINEEASHARARAGSTAQKIGDFWASAMDTSAIEAQGMKPLAAEFARIEKVRDRTGLLLAAAQLQYIGVGAMFSTPIFQDEKRSDRYALHLYQGGLGLPNRDYYFDTDERSTMIRREYETHVAKMFGLLGDDDARARAHARTVMTIETELAGASRKLEELRDPHANYNRMSLDELGTLTPSVAWRPFLAATHIRGVDTVIVGQPDFFRRVETSLAAHTIEEWKAYLRWHLASTFASQAGGAWDAESFRFFGTILNGTPVQRPRWKRMLDQEEAYLGDALGQLYVARYFSPRTKARYEKLTDEIFDAFRARLARLDWMSEATRQRARRKLDAVTKKVGYPEKWKDYSSYRVDRSSFLGNCVRGNAWQSDWSIAKLSRPVDRSEWDMTPQTYNAYYNPSNNEIVLPAAIFILPGIADSLVDDAVVYAYAGGTTIGHEITHGFDDEGRQFDERGNLESWWSEDDEREFNRRAAGIVRQYDDYIAVGDLHVNGKATAGENIADLGGIVLGWEAFTRTEQYRKGESLGGLTPAQRYFVGWALGWMNQRRPENVAMRVKTDVHAPSFLRVIGPVSNMEPFYEAYGVQPGDRMHRADDVRVKIW